MMRIVKLLRRVLASGWAAWQNNQRYLTISLMPSKRVRIKVINPLTIWISLSITWSILAYARQISRSEIHSRASSNSSSSLFEEWTWSSCLLCFSWRWWFPNWIMCKITPNQSTQGNFSDWLENSCRSTSSSWLVQTQSIKYLNLRCWLNKLSID